MLEPSLHIRSATPADSQALADLGRLTFEATFADQNSAQDMAAYLAQAFGVERVAADLLDPGVTYLLAERGSGLAGYAKLRRGPADPSVRGPSPVELERLYAHPQALGTGVGAALMERSLAEARAGGFETLWLGVWERNEQAIAFYERWGFVRSGEHVFTLGSDAQTDFIMERAVGPPK